MAPTAADPILTGAIERAREVLLEAADAADVGDSLGMIVDGELAVSHLFECHTPGYAGWFWSVSITRAPDADEVTVNDIVLLPGDDAIVAPPWTPYRERIQPGDLSPGDVLPPAEHDARLVPAWSAGDDDDNAADRAVAKEIALGRPLVLSIEGRAEAVERWYEGEQGPDTPIAQQAPGPCRTCGFLVRMAGPMATMFGVCANAHANDDGRVVAFEHGCGAHSAAKLAKSATRAEPPAPVYDTVTTDDVIPV